MRFQGEICTLSFGLHFNRAEVLVTGNVWLLGQDGQHNPKVRLRFNTPFREADLITLQQWLADPSTETMSLPEPIRQIRRISTGSDNIVRFELDYHHESEPTWWNWEVTKPLKIRLDISANEFVYLTNSLSRENWSNNLSW